MDVIAGTFVDLPGGSYIQDVEMVLIALSGVLVLLCVCWSRQHDGLVPLEDTSLPLNTGTVFSAVPSLPLDFAQEQSAS